MKINIDDQYATLGIQNLTVKNDKKIQLIDMKNLVLMKDQDKLGLTYLWVDKNIICIAKALKKLGIIDGFVVSSAKAGEIMDVLNHPQSRSKILAFTNKEKLFIDLLLQGKGMKEISNEMSISVKTVYSKRNNISEKLKLKKPKDVSLFFSPGASYYRMLDKSLEVNQ